jgi:hypothetical protein
MDAGFNLPQELIKVGPGFARRMFKGCSGAGFQVSPAFSFPGLSPQELDKPGVFMETFSGVAATQRRTAASIIGNRGAGGAGGAGEADETAASLAPAQPRMTFDSTSKAFPDRPTLGANWGGVHPIELTLDANGGSFAGSPPHFTGLRWGTLEAQGLTLPRNGETDAPLLDDAILLGWATAADAESPGYAHVSPASEVDAAGAAISGPVKETLYAIWLRPQMPQPLMPQTVASTPPGADGTGTPKLADSLEGGSGRSGGDDGSGAGTGGRLRRDDGGTASGLSGVGGIDGAEGAGDVTARRVLDAGAGEATGSQSSLVAAAPTAGLESQVRVAGTSGNPTDSVTGGAGCWSLLSLSLCALSAIGGTLSVAVSISCRRRREAFLEHGASVAFDALDPDGVIGSSAGGVSHALVSPLLAVALSAMAFLTWLAGDDMSLAMVWVNSNTPIVAIPATLGTLASGASISLAILRSGGEVDPLGG